MALYCNWNGKIVEEEIIAISPNNRSFRYGDGCFETIKVINRQIVLSKLHFHRLFSSLEKLQFSVPSFFNTAYLQEQIAELIEVNKQLSLARVRLVVYRGDGHLYELEENHLNFIIQSWAGVKDSNYFNPEGLSIDIYKEGKITADNFSAIKSNNYLRQAMAAITAKKKGLDDLVLLNAFGRLADATIANIFIVTPAHFIKTPAIAEGCVSGVMRQYLLQCLQKEGLPFEETSIEVGELLTAREVFLTNANYGIRWVKNIGEHTFLNERSTYLHQSFVAPLFTASTF